MQIAANRAFSLPFLPRQSLAFRSKSPTTLLLTRKRTMYSLPNLGLLHIIFVISPLKIGAYECRGCYAPDTDALYCNVTDMDLQQADCDTIRSCPGGFPASSDCVNDWCECSCADPDNCCGSESSESCFQSSSNGSVLENCAYIASHINSCISATTGFANLSIQDQASCFCFNGIGAYDGYSWDNAATTCYAAMATQTTWSIDQLEDYTDDYSTNYVGACTNYVDTSHPGTSSGGASATAGSIASVLSAASTTATKTSGIPSGTTTGTVPPTTTGPTAAAGTPSPKTTATSTNTGAKNGSEGSGMILSAFLIICCLIASLKQ